jgi:hypothetical protein
MAMNIKQKVMLLLISVLMITVSVSCCSETFAGNIDSLRFIQEVKSKVEDPLPPLSEVLPGYSRPSAEVPSLIVADLTSDKEEEMPWGSAIGRVIRRKLMFAPRILLRMPSVYTGRADGWQQGMSDKDVLRSLESLKLAGRRLGIRNALTGDVKIDGQTYEINIELRSLPSGQSYKTFHYSGDVSRLPDTFATLTIDVYRALGVKLDEKSLTYINKKTPESFEHLKIFAQTLKDLKGKSAKEAREIVKIITKKQINTQAALALYAYYLEPDKDLNAYVRELEDMAAKFPEDAGMESIVAVYMGYKDSEELKRKKIRKFQKIIRENPDDPSNMIDYSEFLSYCGNTRAALTVSLEVLKRWPDLYRTWWSVAFAIMEYNWQERGTNYWVDVPEKAKRMFYPIKSLADKAVNRAMEYNAGIANLWILKMRTIGEYSPQLINSFHRAADLSPHNKEVYDTALCFSRPQWGGSSEIQERIWNLAAKNNPGQPWLEEIRKKHIKKPSDNDR